MHLTRMWRDHVAAGCSGELAGVEIAGSDARELDAEITACVSAYLCRGMAVDERIERRLIEISRALADKQAHSDEHVAACCARLNELVIAVLAESRSTRNHGSSMADGRMENGRADNGRAEHGRVADGAQRNPS